MTKLNPNSIIDGSITLKKLGEDVPRELSRVIETYLGSRLLPEVNSLTSTDVLTYCPRSDSNGSPTWKVGYRLTVSSQAPTNMDIDQVNINPTDGAIYYRNSTILSRVDLESKIGTIPNLAVPATNLVDAINTVLNLIGSGSGGGTTTINDSTILPFHGILTSSQMSTVIEKSLGTAPIGIYLSADKTRFYFYDGRGYYVNSSTVGTLYNRGTGKTDWARNDVLFSYGGKHYICYGVHGVVDISNIYSTLQDELNNLITSITELTAYNLNSVQTTLSNRISVVEQTISGFESLFTTQDNAIQALTRSNQSLTNKVSQLESQLTQLSNRLTQLTSSFNQLSNNLDTTINNIISERIQYCSSESEYNNIQNKESDVLYVIKD